MLTPYIRALIKEGNLEGLIIEKERIQEIVLGTKDHIFFLMSTDSGNQIGNQQTIDNKNAELDNDKKILDEINYEIYRLKNEIQQNDIQQIDLQ